MPIDRLDRSFWAAWSNLTRAVAQLDVDVKRILRRLDDVAGVEGPPTVPSIDAEANRFTAKGTLTGGSLTRGGSRTMNVTAGGDGSSQITVVEPGHLKTGQSVANGASVIALKIGGTWYAITADCNQIS